MNKKYVVRLAKKEREELRDVVRRLCGSSQKARRAQILLKADVRGANWTDAKIAEVFSCRVQTVENLRKRLVTEGFRIALDGKPRETPPREKVLDGKQEAKIIAMRLGKPPKGYATWSLRLLAEHVVELGLIESISHETIRRTLKKTA
ncbi:MAG: helix-turn-helix domain-containing protein [Pirellulaceae bacterium]|nr:helix-turn-helix domain-containing protein [Pirellulaceae bacterium]